jgi:hypothetical protein
MGEGSEGKGGGVGAGEGRGEGYGLGIFKGGVRDVGEGGYGVEIK